MENKWEMLGASNEDREKIWSKNRTFAGDVWFRFRHKPTAIGGLIMIVILMLFALLGPMFTDYSYSTQNLEVVNIPPRMKVYETPDGSGYLYVTQALKVVRVNKDGTMGNQLKKVREESDSSMTIFDCSGTEVALYYGAKPYVIADPQTRVIYPSAHVWNKSYVLGTDSLGRDILTRLMYGTRVSLMVAFVAAAVNMIIGILFGGISGYAGGMVDTVMMRIVDIISTIPLTLYVILIMVYLESGLQSIIIALGTVYWVDMARVVRGQVLSLKQQEFVMAARTIGSSTKTYSRVSASDTECNGFHSGDGDDADSFRDFYGGVFELSGHWIKAASCQSGNHVQRCDGESALLSSPNVYPGPGYLPYYVCLQLRRRRPSGCTGPEA